MIELFPQRTVILETSLNTAEVAQILKKYAGGAPVPISPNPPFSFKTDKKFRGIVHGNQFTLERVLSYVNSFQPILKGEFFSKGDKTVISFRMTMARSVKIFLICFFSFIGFGIYMMLIQKPSSNSLAYELFFAFVLALFAFGFMRYGYFKESDNSINEFKRMLQARETNEK